ncbi:MAG TPA: STAS/SEC14 domain-containing protein [Candidatus Aquilonibacter sp.]|nr:STAS/SEC14 domain-containing protein [Candidatus Aquilonibacter sp.]
MIEKLTDLPTGVDGVKAVGKISREDYEQVMVPLFDEARRSGRRLRFLYQLGPEFEGFTPGAAWEDARIGLQSLRIFDGCAVVTDLGWIREMARFMGFFMPCPVRVFTNVERLQAIDWLAALPEGPAVSHRLIPESGVIVVEVKQALRAQDFDALSATADAWIESHGSLTGLVIHAREFPGWENLGGLLRHLRFVRNHHREVKRIAFAADSRLTNVAPVLGEVFTSAEVKSFTYDDLDIAIAWASKPAAAKTAAPQSAVN